MDKPKPPPSIRMRIIVVSPPAGVGFAVQRGKSDLLAPSGETLGEVRFEFPLRQGAPMPDGAVNFLGEFAQGPPSDRFVYINAGTLAGQADSCWTRRAKLKLASVPKAVVDAASLDGLIEARVQGTLSDGTPVCASIKPEAVVWRHVRDGD